VSTDTGRTLDVEEEFDGDVDKDVAEEDVAEEDVAEEDNDGLCHARY
jgi:hypothetical protein